MSVRCRSRGCRTPCTVGACASGSQAPRGRRGRVASTSSTTPVPRVSPSLGRRTRRAGQFGWMLLFLSVVAVFLPVLSKCCCRRPACCISVLLPLSCCCLSSYLKSVGSCWCYCFSVVVFVVVTALNSVVLVFFMIISAVVPFFVASVRGTPRKYTFLPSILSQHLLHKMTNSRQFSQLNFMFLKRQNLTNTLPRYFMIT